jgi:FtsH-binding integral membrane protein
VNFFLRSDTLYWVISYIGVAVFIGLTAYDTQIINLFLFFLRIFGRRR